MFELPKLPYVYNALEPFIDEQTMKIHHTMHHGTYVKNINDALKDSPQWLAKPIEEIIKSLDQIPAELRTKVRNNGGGHYNHSLFWKIMAPKSQVSQPEGDLLTALNSSFGSLDSFKEQFNKAGLNRFGSGWAWLIVDGGKLAITDTPNQDNPLVESKTPIMGLDVWEHAYYLKYQNRRAEYITNWWNIVNWKQVAENFSQLK